MRITYLGTGADDWLPGEVSTAGEYRRRTAATVDGVLQIDLAATTPLEGLGEVREVLYTHSHRDHFDAETLRTLAVGRELTVYLATDFARRLAACMPENVHAVGLAPGNTVVTPLGYRVTALRANHVVGDHPAEQPLHYIIEKDGRRLYWGTDGAWIAPDAWDALRAARPFDRMILDGTLGDGIGDTRIFTHNNLRMVRELAATFRRAGLLKPNGQIYMTHVSRDSQYPTEELDARLAADGIRAAHDDEEDEF